MYTVPCDRRVVRGSWHGGECVALGQRSGGPGATDVAALSANAGGARGKEGGLGGVNSSANGGFAGLRPGRAEVHAQAAAIFPGFFGGGTATVREQRLRDVPSEGHGFESQIGGQEPDRSSGGDVESCAQNAGSAARNQRI